MELPEFEHLSHMGSTGLSWAANSGESTGSGQRRYIAADGIENVIKILEAIEDEQFTRLDFVELSACPGGCVGGVMNVENPYAAAARIKRLACHRLVPSGPPRNGCRRMFTSIKRSSR